MTTDTLLPIILLGFVPMIVYSAAVWSFDRYEKEPWWLLAMAFVWGAVPAVVLTIIAQHFTGPLFATEIRRFMQLVVLAPLWEELAKGVALVLLFVFLRRELDSLVDGVVYGSLVGFGFSATEDVSYYIRAFEQGGADAVVELGLLRSYLTGLGHAVFTAMFGIGIVLARHGPTPRHRVKAPFLGLAGAMGLHAAYNMGTLIGLHWAVAAFPPIVLYRVLTGTLALESKWIATDLHEEVRNKLLHRGEIRILVSPRARTVRLARAWMDHGFYGWRWLSRYYHTATELAFQKRHLRELGEDPHLREQVARLRRELKQLADRLPEGTRGFPRRKRRLRRRGRG